MGVNYGADKVRFPAPVPVGSRIRGSGQLVEAESAKGGAVQAKVRVTVEIEEGPARLRRRDDQPLLPGSSRCRSTSSRPSTSSAPAAASWIEMLRSRWAPYLEEAFGVRLFGVWATAGSTANWPEANALWEMDDWDHFARAQQARYPLEDKDAYGCELTRHSLLAPLRWRVLACSSGPHSRPTGRASSPRVSRGRWCCARTQPRSPADSTTI